MRVEVIFTCYNRKKKTVICVNSLLRNKAEMEFTIVDDDSSDGTTEALKQMVFTKNILCGSGNLFWAGGMRVGIDFVLKNKNEEIDYILLVNDDVEFFENSIDKMIEESISKNNAVIVGNCCNNYGESTYGAIKFNKVYKKPMYYHLSPEQSEMCADTFNCNAVLIPRSTMKSIGNFDPIYTHNFADYDYGFMLKKNGFKIFGTSFYVGVCSADKPDGTWTDRKLSRKQRMKLKESPKGLPQKEWNHFLIKNLGVIYWIRYGYVGKIKVILGQ